MDLMPHFDTCPFLFRGDAIQNLQKMCNPVLWKLDGHILSINDPTKNSLDGHPGAVTLLKLLEGHRFTASWGVTGIIQTEHIIDDIEQDTADLMSIRMELGKPNKIIHKHIHVRQRLRWKGEGWVTSHGL